MNREDDGIQSELDRLERKLDKTIQRIEEECGRLSETANKYPAASRGCGGNVLWGGILVVGGFIWLGDRLHWYDISLPWGPVILIVIGTVLVLKSRR